MEFFKALKGTLFIDIDGTIVEAGTEQPLEMAVEKINKAYDDGYMIIITTMRGSGFAMDSKFSCPETLRLLKSIGLKYHDIIWNVPSPRYIINDEGAGAIQHKANSSWDRY